MVALLIFHIFDEISMHKQQERVLHHLQTFRVAVGFSGKSCKIMANEAIHALDGVRMCFSGEMSGRLMRLSVCQ